MENETIASHNFTTTTTTTTKKPLSHVTETFCSSSPSGDPGVQVSGQKEGKMEGHWDWYVPPPWGETTAGIKSLLFVDTVMSSKSYIVRN